MSANSLSYANGAYKYDFSIDSSQVYGGMAGFVKLSPDRWGMPAGDVNQNGEIEPDDKTIWKIHAGEKNYFTSDINLDGQSNHKDINDYWIKNISLECQVPE